MLCGKTLANNFFKYKRKVFSNISQSIRRCIGTSRLPKVLFFGTDNFSLPSLKKLHQNNLDLTVVTSFKSPANCVRSYAEAQKLSIYRWPISVEQCADFELGVVVSFGHMIPLHIINALPRGIINVHASLLPRWRGAAPIMYAIMEGDTKTGISIMKIEPHQFDIGPVRTNYPQTNSHNSTCYFFRYWRNVKCPLKALSTCQSFMMPCRNWVPTCLWTQSMTWKRDF